MVVTRPSQPRRANAPVFYPQHRPSGGSGGWYSPLALRIRDALRGRLSILMPILVTATMPAMAMTRTAATTATTIQSTRNYDRLGASPVDLSGSARAPMSFWMSSSAKNNEGTVSVQTPSESNSLSPP